MLVERSPDGLELSQHCQFPTADLPAVTMHDPGHVLIFDPARDHQFLAVLFCGIHCRCGKRPPMWQKHRHTVCAFLLSLPAVCGMVHDGRGTAPAASADTSTQKKPAEAGRDIPPVSPQVSGVPLSFFPSFCALSNILTREVWRRVRLLPSQKIGCLQKHPDIEEYVLTPAGILQLRQLRHAFPYRPSCPVCDLRDRVLIRVFQKPCRHVFLQG